MPARGTAARCSRGAVVAYFEKARSEDQKRAEEARAEDLKRSDEARAEDRKRAEEARSEEDTK